MFTMEVAGHRFRLDPVFPDAERLCRDYLVPDCAEIPPWRISETERAFENRTDRKWTEPYAEMLAFSRKICEVLSAERIVLFHGSALSFDGAGILFAGPSGCGKSTQSRLWRRHFPGHVTMINDDKPLLLPGFPHTSGAAAKEIRLAGTPFGGDPPLQTNTSAPLRAVIFPVADSVNRIGRLSDEEALSRLLFQVYRPEKPEQMLETIRLIREMSRYPVYQLNCTTSEEAAELVFRTVFRKTHP